MECPVKEVAFGMKPEWQEELSKEGLFLVTVKWSAESLYRGQVWQLLRLKHMGRDE